MKTQIEIPQSVKSVLWSYDLGKIDFDLHKRLVIAQILNYGNREATSWLFRRYSKAEVVKEAVSIPLGQWDKKSLAMWSLYLGIRPQSRSERILHGR